MRHRGEAMASAAPDRRRASAAPGQLTDHLTKLNGTELELTSGCKFWRPTKNTQGARMDAQRSSFLVLTLAIAAVTPVSAQMPTAASQSVLIPDFSGVWGHPYLFPGFEPPLSGPGPLVNKFRRKQLVDADGRPLPANEAVLPGDNNKLVADHTNPILKPLAAETVKKHGEIELAGAAALNPSNQCWPEPLPYIFWNFGMQMLQQPDKITILYDQDHEFRRVRMNQPHPEHVTPSWYGDSVGHYEGDTLVVDTVGRSAVRNGRHVWYALYAGVACCGTLSAAGLRGGKGSTGAGRKGALAPSWPG
jgi:hypothetical protein